MSDAETYCILISDTETFTHTYKLIPECAHTNILISDKWILFGMWIQKTDAKRMIPTETISIEPYANGPHRGNQGSSIFLPFGQEVSLALKNLKKFII